MVRTSWVADVSTGVIILVCRVFTLSPTEMSSDYFKGLDIEAQNRYREKLSFRGQELPDPLDGDLVRFSFSSDSRNFPPVTAADIFMYLVEGVCFYTKEQFKSHKMGEAYNAFVSGKVKRLVSFKAGKRGEGIVVIAATVEASQMLTKAYQPWCVVQDDGTVTSAHCTCMAGLGECCTHVAALLFSVEATVKYGLNNPSPTDVACRWIEVSRKSVAAPLSGIIFFKPKVGQAVIQVALRPRGPVPTWTDEQVRGFMHRIKALAPKTLLLCSITDSEETDSAPEAADQEPERPAKRKETPSQLPLGGIYQNMDLKAAQEVRLTAAHCTEIEKATRGQSRSLRWKQERKGRITASVLGRVATCQSGADGLVAEVMGYIEAPRVSNLRWGSEKEPEAKRAFIAKESLKHKDLQLNECGLFVVGSLPFLAASPDAIVSCACCEKAVLEVKCAASMKGASLTKTSKRLPYLDENLQLRHDHGYYAQVQAQMAATKLRRAYFAVFTGPPINIEVITFDENFWAAAKLKAECFFINHIFPELQSVRIFKQIKCARTTCHCHGARSGRVVECSLCCDIFHLKCVNLKRTPRSWVCTACQTVSRTGDN
ncbi:uncharacterized protein LOC115313676 [Ixodes scapularis]|uniref:uncharacterized protein LOC115313676 n=1 Tax=Ixodes scapularis TaxID=6945 RepID=UPI001AD65683|nr:uncharacterized protein LOC115313676 [Ixodes scapularis]